MLFFRRLRTWVAVAVAIATGAAAAPAALAQSDGSLRAGRKARSASAERLVIDRVVAVVNDEILLESELRRRMAPLAADLEAISDARERQRRRKLLGSSALDEMVNEVLILQAAREAKLEVSSDEVDGALEEIKRQNNVDDAGLAQALELQGYTMSSYRNDVRKQIMRMRAVNVLVRSRVNVSDEDVRAAYDARRRRSGAISKVLLRHVLIALPERPTEQQLRAAKARAADVVTQARSGADFGELAKTLSDDDATKNEGGELGWIERGSIATEWEAIVFAMKKGEVRGPVSGPRGLHVFYVADLERAEMDSFEDMKAQLRGELYRKELDKQTKQWLEEQRKNAFIELKL